MSVTRVDDRKGPARADLLRCVHCGLCLTACPTYRETAKETESPRGRIYLMRALSEGRIDPSREVARHLDLCLNCRACETACPAGVHYGLLYETHACAPAARNWRRRSPSACATPCSRTCSRSRSGSTSCSH